MASDFDQFANWTPQQQAGVAPIPQNQYSAQNAPQNYSAQLEQMLAPYRQQASQMYNPYQTMQPNSFLAQHLGPGAAGMVNSAMNTVADMGPNNGTIGGSIQSVMQGLKGNQMDIRNNAINQQQLPYQLAKAPLAMEDQMAQMSQRGIAYQNAQRQQNRLDDQNALWQAQIQKDQHPPLSAEQLKANIAMGMTKWSNGQSPSTPEEYQQYGKNLTGMDHPPSAASQKPFGSSAFGIGWAGANKPAGADGSYTPQQYDQFLADKLKNDTQTAGGRSGATQSATQPQKDVDSEVKQAQGELIQQKPMSAKDYADSQMMGPGAANYFKDPAKAYSAYTDSVDQKNMQGKITHDGLIADFQAQARQTPGLKWHQFLLQKAQQGPSSGGTGGPPAGAHIRKWNPATNQLE